jgi:signal transduction histidine kinase
LRSLYTRLAVAFLLIIAAVGGGFYLVERWSSAQYHEELTQRLNGSIAMYVTGQTTLIKDGEVNQPELKRLAEQAMVINPSVEVYLLDTEGAILGHSLPPESVLLQRIDLAPIKQLIDGDARLPLRGEDPRNPERSKVFSASPVIDGEVLQGFLYVILGGKQYDELADTVRSSYVSTITLGAITALVCGGFLVGLLVFGVLTRRLSKLTDRVRHLADSGLYPTADEPGGSPSDALQTADSDRLKTTGQDEISRLDAAFTAMAEKINEQFDALQETDRLRRELISNVSHDLRTPLATMHGYVDTLLLKNEVLSAQERQHYLRITHKHTQHLAALIGDLFEISKLESGNLPLSLESFPLAELLHDVVLDFELEARRQGIELSLISPPTAAEVTADIALMQRVLENLIRNALQYTPAGGTITVSLEQHDQQLAVAVADSGRGIPEQQIENIFDRFYTSQHEQQDNVESTGLGLAIVKRILDLHNSRITVVSEVNRGTRFEFELPVAKAA